MVRCPRPSSTSSSTAGSASWPTGSGSSRSTAKLRRWSSSSGRIARAGRLNVERLLRVVGGRSRYDAGSARDDQAGFTGRARAAGPPSAPRTAQAGPPAGPGASGHQGQGTAKQRRQLVDGPRDGRRGESRLYQGRDSEAAQGRSRALRAACSPGCAVCWPNWPEYNRRTGIRDSGLGT